MKDESCACGLDGTRVRTGKGTVCGILNLDQQHPQSTGAAAPHKAALNERVYADLLRNPAAIGWSCDLGN